MSATEKLALTAVLALFAAGSLLLAFIAYQIKLSRKGGV